MSADCIQPEILGSNIGEVLTEAELCRLLGVGKTTVWKLRTTGQLKSCEVGFNHSYLRENTLEFLRNPVSARRIIRRRMKKNSKLQEENVCVPICVPESEE
jgi:hypothetical protein